MAEDGEEFEMDTKINRNVLAINKEFVKLVNSIRVD
jgi:hypothetical protein